MKRCNRAFTLAELLITVGLLVVLLAAAIPGIVAIKRNLEQRKLDDYARIIFVEAQNQLMSRSVAGTIAAVNDLAQTSGEFNWLLNNDTIRSLMTGDAIDIIEEQCHCVLKYNPQTATVLEVYYALGSMDTNAAMTGDYAGADKASLRKELKIGYFSGDDAESGSIINMPVPLVKITNGQELTVKVTVPATGSMGSAACKVTVEVQQLDGRGKPVEGRSFVLDTVDNVPLAAGLEQEWVLDSLSNNLHFYQLCKGSITPGANIMVTAIVSISTGGSQRMAYLSSTGSDKGNSLFASASGTTAKMANGRHLQNLDFDSSHVQSISAAVQNTDLNWYTTQEYYSAKYSQYGGSTANVFFNPINTKAIPHRKNVQQKPLSDTIEL